MNRNIIVIIVTLSLVSCSTNSLPGKYEVITQTIDTIDIKSDAFLKETGFESLAYDQIKDKAADNDNFSISYVMTEDTTRLPSIIYTNLSQPEPDFTVSILPKLFGKDRPPMYSIDSNFVNKEFGLKDVSTIVNTGGVPLKIGQIVDMSVFVNQKYVKRLNSKVIVSAAVFKGAIVTSILQWCSK